jgi:NAD(P)H-dependent flavin oxidoreductase YrpB (nitropropane dioxygenase family)
VNFFCHTPPASDDAREAAWRRALAPYFDEFGVDPATIVPATRRPFDDAAAELLAEFKPPIVSFHFGLPSPELLARVQAWGAKDPVVGDHGRRGAVARGSRRGRRHRAGCGSRRTPRDVSD